VRHTVQLDAPPDRDTSYVWCRRVLHPYDANGAPKMGTTELMRPTQAASHRRHRRNCRSGGPALAAVRGSCRRPRQSGAGASAHSNRGSGQW